MGVKTEAGVVINLIEHVRGQPYPEIDFTAIAERGVEDKATQVAISNEELRTLIDARRMLTGSDKVIVAYYAWE